MYGEKWRLRRLARMAYIKPKNKVLLVTVPVLVVGFVANTVVRPFRADFGWRGLAIKNALMCAKIVYGYRLNSAHNRFGCVINMYERAGDEWFVLWIGESEEVCGRWMVDNFPGVSFVSEIPRKTLGWPLFRTNYISSYPRPSGDAFTSLFPPFCAFLVVPFAWLSPFFFFFIKILALCPETKIKCKYTSTQ